MAVVLTVPINLFADWLSNGGVPLFPFLLAVLAAARLGGLGPGLAATVLSAIVARLSAPPYGSLWLTDIGEEVRLAIFFALGVAISIWAEAFRRSEVGRRQSELLFKTLAESVPALIWVTDGGGRPTYANPRLTDYTTLDPDTPSAWTWGGCVHSDDLAATQEAARTSLKTGEPFSVEHRLRGPDGRYRLFAARAVPVRDAEGAIIRWVGTSLDIEDNRRLAEVQAAARATDQFLVSISHELRTPLTAVSGWVDMLQRFGSRLDPGRTEEGLAAIRHGIRILSRLITDLVDSSRVIAGKLHLSLRPTDLAGVVRRALDAVRPAAEAKHVRLESALDGPAETVTADPDRLEQVLWNLLSNAVKFTPEGGRVRVTLGTVGDEAQIAVADTGRGIRAEHLERIFERFWQVEGSRGSDLQSGFGVGLSLVRYLVERHGGTVTAESAGEGRGATFTVRLPLKRPAAPEAAETASAAAAVDGT